MVTLSFFVNGQVQTACDDSSMIQDFKREKPLSVSLELFSYTFIILLLLKWNYNAGQWGFRLDRHLPKTKRFHFSAPVAQLNKLTPV